MNNIFHYIDLKITVFAAFVAAATATQIDVAIKILSGLVFLGYTAHRWVLMIKEHKKNNKK